MKLEDEDTGDIHFTNVSCKLLGAATCRCSDYANRQAHVSDCVKLTPEVVASISWLPPTCAYRLVEEGRGLMWWHPLVSGRAETVHEAGISVRGKPTVSEDDVALEDIPDHIVTWPTRWPKRARKEPTQTSPGAESGGEAPAPQSLADPLTVRRDP